jgi:hypothetical protein
MPSIEEGAELVKLPFTIPFAARLASLFFTFRLNTILVEKDLIRRALGPHPIASAADELLRLTIDPWEEHDRNGDAAYLAVLYEPVICVIRILALFERPVGLDLNEPPHLFLDRFVFALKCLFVIRTSAW